MRVVIQLDEQNICPQQKPELLSLILSVAVLDIVLGPHQVDMDCFPKHCVHKQVINFKRLRKLEK